MIRGILLGLAIIPAIFADLPIQQCGHLIDDRFLPLAVRNPDCTGGTCYLSLASSFQFEIDAISPFPTTSMMVTMNMHYKIPDNLEAVIPLDLPDRFMDGCQGLIAGAACPLGERERFTWRMDWNWTDETGLEVGADFLLKVWLYDENEIVISCFAIPAIIVA